MILYLKGEVTDRWVDDLVSFLNDLKSTDNKIYIRTEGGDFHSAQSVIEILNNNTHRIELIATGEISSAGFLIFFAYEGEKSIVEGTQGLWHLPQSDTRINAMGKASDAGDKYVRDMVKAYMRPFVKDFHKSTKIPKGKRKAILKGNDVYFLPHELQDLLKKQLK